MFHSMFITSHGTSQLMIPSLFTTYSLDRQFSDVFFWGSKFLTDMHCSLETGTARPPSEINHLHVLEAESCRASEVSHRVPGGIRTAV